MQSECYIKCYSTSEINPMALQNGVMAFPTELPDMEEVRKRKATSMYGKDIYDRMRKERDGRKRISAE